MINSTEVLIKEKEKQKQELVTQMEVIKEKYLEQLIVFVDLWIEKESLSTIKSNPDKVIDLGESRAKELKNEIMKLREGSSELVYKNMNSQHIWWHTNQDKALYYGDGYKLLNRIDKPIRKMFGVLGGILADYGIVKIGTDYGAFNSSAASSSWSNEGYKMRITYSDELYETNKAYVSLISETQRINLEIEELENQKKRENVEEWWDSL
ncbi:hypothetical protein P4534_21365 [Peribacillus butanolivorans]|uniref:hypothetical protein n=1 Tax=Peribacillus butanolivorans TaxID=421767 RepID=UPI002E1DB91B|nr:hypothetical protein [Peribacillus butanolivorans]